MGPSVARAVGPSGKETRGMGGGDNGKWLPREATTTTITITTTISGVQKKVFHKSEGKMHKKMKMT